MRVIKSVELLRNELESLKTQQQELTSSRAEVMKQVRLSDVFHDLPWFCAIMRLTIVDMSSQLESRASCSR